MERQSVRQFGADPVCGPLAQSVEQLAFNQWVVGSIPTRLKLSACACSVCRRGLEPATLASPAHQMKLKPLLKILISAAMLALVFYYVDIGRLKERLLQVPLSLALLVVLGYAAGQVLSSYKWWLIARPGMDGVPWSRALRAYFIGNYANSFGLGLLGGDVLRGLVLAGKDGGKTRAFASVVADRAHGLAVLVVLGTIFAFCDGRNLISPDMIYLLLLIPLGVVVGWVIGPQVLLSIIPAGTKLRVKAEGLIEIFPKDLPTIVWITTVSVVFHVSQILLHAVMAAALGLDIPLLLLFSSVPFVNILASLPISWNGLGIRENSYMWLLSSAGLSWEDALAFGAMWLLAVTASSAIGGIVSLLGKDRGIQAEPEPTT